MNERMLELARQAGLKKPHASDSEYLIDFDWRLFGDLIVLECLHNMENCDGDLDLAIWKTKKDFGLNDE